MALFVLGARDRCWVLHLLGPDQGCEALLRVVRVRMPSRTECRRLVRINPSTGFHFLYLITLTYTSTYSLTGVTVSTERTIFDAIRSQPERMKSIPTTPEEFVAVYQQSDVARNMRQELEDHLAATDERNKMTMDFKEGVKHDKAKSVSSNDPHTVSCLLSSLHFFNHPNALPFPPPPLAHLFLFVMSNRPDSGLKSKLQHCASTS